MKQQRPITAAYNTLIAESEAAERQQIAGQPVDRDRLVELADVVINAIDHLKPRKQAKLYGKRLFAEGIKQSYASEPERDYNPEVRSYYLERMFA